MIERIFLLVGITLMLIVILALLKKRQVKQAQSAAQLATDNVNKSSVEKPQLIYFWSTQCNQCKSIQAPIVENLSAIIGKDKFTVNKYNVNESPVHAKNWAVKTVPTIYVLDRAGKIQHINNGLTTEKTLIKQIEILVT